MLSPLAQQLANHPVDHNLQMEMESHYNKLNQKLDNLQHKWNHDATHKDLRKKTSTYPRTINLTNIKFTAEEQTLLDVGLQ